MILSITWVDVRDPAGVRKRSWAGVWRAFGSDGPAPRCVIVFGPVMANASEDGTPLLPAGEPRGSKGAAQLVSVIFSRAFLITLACILIAFCSGSPVSVFCVLGVLFYHRALSYSLRYHLQYTLCLESLTVISFSNFFFFWLDEMAPFQRATPTFIYIN